MNTEAPRRAVPLSTLSVADALTPEPLEDPPPVPRPQRRSSLRPRRLGPGNTGTIENRQRENR